MTTTIKQTNVPTGRYSFSQLEALWINSGGPKWIAPVMAAIALAESKGDPNAKHTNSDGSIDRGLWQINSAHKYGTSSLNPANNAHQAVSVYHSQGLPAWSTYKNGSYKKYLPKGTTIIGRGITSPPPSSGGIKIDIPTPGDIARGAGIPVPKVPSPGDIARPIESALLLGLKEAMYALAILGGGMLILLGLLFIGVDIGISGLNNKKTQRLIMPVRAYKRVTDKRTSKPPIPGDLPGPEE